MDKIYTSYFANLRNLPDNVCPISICGKAPDWYKGIQYKALAPKYWFFKKYKEDGDAEFYKNRPVKNTKSSALCMKQGIC